METRANFVAVGAFVVVVLMGAFGFAWWLNDPTESTRSSQVIIRFPGDVSGLVVGAPVYFNGIRVGDVNAMNFDPDDPEQVLISVFVDKETPLRKDTLAQLGFQGLTGVAYVKFIGGSSSAPRLLQDDGTIPLVLAEKSSFDDILASVKELLGTVNTIAEQANALLETNKANVDVIVANVSQFSQALGDNADQVNAALGAVSDVALSFSALAERVGGLSERAEAILQAVDPQKVAAMVNSTAAMASGLGDVADNLPALLVDLKTSSQELATFTKGLNGTLSQVDGVIDSLDPAVLQRTMAALEALAASLADRTGEIETILANTQKLTGDLTQISGPLADRSEPIGQIVTDTAKTAANVALASEEAPALIGDARRFMAALDVEGINATLGHVRRLTQALAARTAQIETTIDHVAMAADDVRQVTGTVAGRRQEIDAMITDVTQVAAELDEIASRASRLMAAMTSLLSDEATGGLVRQATAAVQSIRQTADAFGRRADDISNGLASFSTRGLQDAEALISDGRRTVQSLDRLLSRIERNPRAFLFGADSGPRDFDRRRY